MHIETNATVPRLRHITEALVRYHNVVDACMVPKSPMLAGSTEAQAAILQLKHWQEDEQHEQGNPPHLVAGLALHASIHQDVELVLDALPELVKRWDPSFKRLFNDIFTIIDDWKSGCDSYDASLTKAYCLARRAAGLAKRVDAKADAQESAHEPSGGSVAEHGTDGSAETPTDTATPDTDWRDVQRRLMELYERRDPYTSIGDLAKRLGCAKATIQKAMNPDQSALSGLTEDEKAIAIQNAEQLRKWQAQRSKGKATLRATSLTEVVSDNTPQTVEANPSDVVTDDDVEKAMRHLIEEAKPEERAKLNDLDAEGRRAMAQTYYAHKLDEEPSPLEDDPPDKRPKQVKEYKRV